MDDKIKQLVSLAREQGYTWGDIAQTIGIPESTLKYYVKAKTKPFFKDSDLYKKYLSGESLTMEESEEQPKILQVDVLSTLTTPEEQDMWSFLFPRSTVEEVIALIKFFVKILQDPVILEKDHAKAVGNINYLLLELKDLAKS
jgi:hypothetical protein